MQTPELASPTDSILLDVFQSEYTFLLVSLFIFLMLGIIFWLEVYEFPRQKRYKALWLREHNSLLESEKLIIQLLEELGRESSCCSKCGHFEMRIWDVRDRFLIVRCTNCQLNRTLCEENRPIIRRIRKAASSIDKLIEESRSKRHEMLGQYLMGYFQFNYFNRIKSDPQIRAITFNVQKAI